MYVNGPVGIGADPGSFRLKVGQPGAFGFAIENLNTLDDWEFYVGYDVTLNLYLNGGQKGYFDTDGTYFPFRTGG
jgi:hypothetical protein